MKAFHQHIRRFAASLIGIVFLVSGILKLWDPVGTGLIVTEYGKLVGIGLTLSLAKGLGMALSITECLLGIGLITGVLRKLVAIATCCLLSVFTIITLLLWIYNPSMSCGCFGEAYHLTHAQSFWKNVVLLALAAIAFIPFKEYGKPRPHRVVTAVLAVAVLCLGAVRSGMHLPMVDFTEYNWGARLFASLDENAAEDDFRKAAMLSFSSEDGEYADNLAAAGKVLVLSVYDLESAPWERLLEQYRAAEATDVIPLVILASYAGDPALEKLPADIPLYFADYKTLITLNRSNGGGTYFYDGEIVHKWASADFPEDIASFVAEDPVALSSHYVTRRRLLAQAFCVIMAAIFVLV